MNAIRRLLRSALRSISIVSLALLVAAACSGVVVRQHSGQPELSEGLNGDDIAARFSVDAKTRADTALDNLFTADDVFNLEFASDPQISPDGRLVVYLRKSMDELTDRVNQSLWLIDIDNGEHRSLVGERGKQASARWSPSGDQLVYSIYRDGKTELRVFDMTTERSKVLLRSARSPGAPGWSPDGKAIAFTMFVPGESLTLAKPKTASTGSDWSEPVRVFDDLVIAADGSGYQDKGASHVFVISTQGGAPTQVTDGDADFSTPLWLSNEKIVVVGFSGQFPEPDSLESDIYVVDVKTKQRIALTNRDGPDKGIAVSPDRNMIAYVGYDNERNLYQKTDLYIMMADGSGVRNLTSGYDRSVGIGIWRAQDAIQWSPDGRSVIALVERDGALSLVSIPLSGTPSTIVSNVGGSSVGRPSARGQFSVAANDRTESLFAYTSGRHDRPADVSIASSTGMSKQLTGLNEDLLGQLALARIEAIRVTSSYDGRAIDAWIAFPPGFDANATYPMILEIHGGPDSMYGPFFSAEIQRYAAEGFITVYANPRGSTGYGEEFTQLIERAFPGHDYDDLMSVVDHVLKRKYVDPDRVFVTGGSAGGTMTAWIVGKTHRFAAAAAVKPTINLTSSSLTTDLPAFTTRYWHRQLPWEDPEYYWKHSPLSLVGNVTTPTLLMVGDQDHRTPLSEAQQFYTALKLIDVDTAFVLVPGASHSIASRPSRLNAKVDNILGWFEKYDVPVNAGTKITD